MMDFLVIIGIIAIFRENPNEMSEDALVVDKMWLSKVIQVLYQADPRGNQKTRCRG